MNRVLAIVLLLSASFAVAQGQHDISDNLSRQCGLALDVNVYHPRKIKSKFEAYDLGFCLGMIKGVYTTGSGRDFCPKDGVPVKDTIELTVKFVVAHPDLQKKDSADIVRWALSDEFPCHKQDRSNEADSEAKNK
jgi:hypothetical protein